MTAGNWIELVIAGIFFLIVALSAWIETSLATVTRVNLRALLEGRISRPDEREIEGPQHIRSSMLLIEMISVGISTALVAYVAWEQEPDYGLWAGIAAATLLHVILGRIVPRIATGEERSEQSTAQGIVARSLTILFAPIIRPVDALVAAFTRRKTERESNALPADEDADGSNGDREGDGDDEIEPVEQEMISGVLHLEHSTASEIMVPRIDIVAIESSASIETATEVAIGAGHSRIPVFGQSIDEIVGIVYAKDLLRYVAEDPTGVEITSILRPCYYVPESKRVDDLLRELQQARVHMAVVVDEYGGTAGVVTIEDIIEEIVGEIEDEYDTEQPYIDEISDTEAIVAGKVSVEDLIHDLKLDLPSSVPGTVGGFVQKELGRIPKQGETLEINGIRMTVMEIEHRRIRRIRIERLPLQPASAQFGSNSTETEES